MPAAVAARQFEHPAEAWLSEQGVLDLLREEVRQSRAELARFVGQYGLHIRPCADIGGEIPDASVRHLISLHRRGESFSGDLRCGDGGLPLAGASVSLAFAQHVLESSNSPAALVAELARVIKPEGHALFLVFNPVGIARLRWRRHALLSISPNQLSGWARGAGLEVIGCRFVGVFWRAPSAAELGGSGAGRFTSRLRSSYLMITRRREAGMTPLRPARGGVTFKPGVSAG